MEHENRIKSIFNAVQNGNLYLIQSILSGCSDAYKKLLLSQTEKGCTLLLKACCFKPEIFKYLVENCQLDVNQTGVVECILQSGDKTVKYVRVSPLWYAASINNLQAVKSLVVLGADVNFSTAHPLHPTALHITSYKGHTNIARYLVEHGANVNSTNDLGVSCLMSACQRGNNAVTKLLLENGANTACRSDSGDSVLHYIQRCKQPHISTIKLLLKQKVKLEKNLWGVTPVMVAAIIGHVDVVDFFLTQKDVAIPLTEKRDAVELACVTFDHKRDLSPCKASEGRRKAQEWRQLLKIQRGYPDYRFTKNELNSIFQFDSTQRGYILKLLIDMQSDIRLQGFIVYARVLGSRHFLTKFPVRAIANDLSTDVKLRMAFRSHLFGFDQGEHRFHEYLRAFEFLEEHYKDLSFKECLQVLNAVTREMCEGTLVCPLNEADTISFNKTMHSSVLCIKMCYEKSKKMINADDLREELKVVVGKYQALGFRGSGGMTAVQLALCHMDKCKLTCTPCSCAVSPDMISFLIRNGADPNQKDNDGNTVLHVAVQKHKHLASMNDLQAIIQVFLDYGAHFDSTNGAAQTFCDVASEKGMNLGYRVFHFTTLQCLTARVIGEHLQGRSSSHLIHIPWRLQKLISYHQTVTEC